MKDELVETLESLNYPVFQQGTMNHEDLKILIQQEIPFMTIKSIV